MTKVIAVVSGGMDSVTALYYARNTYSDSIRVLSFDYGQKHWKELSYAAWHVRSLDLPHDVVNLGTVRGLLTNSALTGDQPVPEGHYADETMKATVVPNRNMMMLAIATAVAVNDGADCVVAGMHAGDHPVYPDCRPQFIDAMNDAVRVGNEGFAVPNFKIWAPFIGVSKDHIVREGTKLGVDYAHTWSCYKGGEYHCGKCGTCVERKEAFELAGVDDPTVYMQ